MTIMIEKIPTPFGIYHIHNLAMRGLVITATNLPPKQKEEIKELVNFMGALYLDTLNDTVTHLISTSVVSSIDLIFRCNLK